MSRVEATLSDSRSSVATSNTVGKAEKSSALRLDADTTSTVIDSAIDNDNMTSSSVGPTGATIPASTSIAVAGSANLGHRDEGNRGSRARHQATPCSFARRASARMTVASTSAIAR